MLSEKIAFARKARGMGKKELADAIGKSPSAITQIESGETKTIKVDTEKALSKALRVQREYFSTTENDWEKLKFDSDMILHDESGLESASLSASNSVRADYVLSGSHSELMATLQAKEIPPHIEQAILALLSTCKDKEEADPAAGLSEADKELRRKILLSYEKTPVDQKYVFPEIQDGMLNPDLHGGVDRKIVFVDDGDPAVSVDPQKKKAAEK